MSTLGCQPERVIAKIKFQHLTKNVTDVWTQGEHFLKTSMFQQNNAIDHTCLQPSSGGLQQDCTAIMQAVGRNLAPFLHRKHNTEKRSSNEAFIFSKHYNNDSLGAARFFFRK